MYSIGVSANETGSHAALQVGWGRLRHVGTLPVLVALALLLALTGAYCLKEGATGAALLSAQDDPARLTELRLPAAVTPERVAAEIDEALALGDEDLAQSFVALADEQRVSVDGERRAKVTALVAEKAPAAGSDLAGGFVNGKGEGWAGTIGSLTADLIGYSDLRDLWVEGGKFADGQDYDRVLLGMSAAGIALTGTTLLTLGTSSPATVPAGRGIAILKVARRTGLMSRAMLARLGRLSSEVVDASKLKQAVAAARVLDLPATRQAVWGAVRPNGLRVLRQIGADTVALEARIGQRGAFQALGVARDAREISRARRLADTLGKRTRAALKVLGPAALVLGNLTAVLLQAVWLALVWSIAAALWARRFGLTVGRMIFRPPSVRRAITATA